MLLVVLPLGGAGAVSKRTRLFYDPQWFYIHLHLNAYAHWGRCTNHSIKDDEPSWHDKYVDCGGLAELGELHGTPILAHSSLAGWSWAPEIMTVHGKELDGREWKLDGRRPPDFNYYIVTSSTIVGKHYVTGTNTAHRGEKGGPLAVNLSSHIYSQGLRIDKVGFSLNLQGWIELAK